MDGLEQLKDKKMDLVQLVVNTSLWAHPRVVDFLYQEENNASARWFINARRVKKSEKTTGHLHGLYLDSNTKASYAIKSAMGIKEPLTNYATCHVYDGTTYDCAYHTALVPRPIYSLTDHLDECKEFMQYYSYAKYGFYIIIPPKKPSFWDSIDLTKMYASSDTEIDKALIAVKRRKQILEPKTTNIITT